MKKSVNESSGSRRSFLKKLIVGSVLTSTAPAVLASPGLTQTILISRNYPSNQFAANDQVNLATIGVGIQGIYDTRSALTVSGVKLVAACDLYKGRLARAKELFGDDIFTTRDYREILDRKDVDAVIVATPDHWHKKISIEAMKRMVYKGLENDSFDAQLAWEAFSQSICGQSEDFQEGVNSFREKREPRFKGR